MRLRLEGQPGLGKPKARPVEVPATKHFLSFDIHFAVGEVPAIEDLGPVLCGREDGLKSLTTFDEVDPACGDRKSAVSQRRVPHGRFHPRLASARRDPARFRRAPGPVSQR